MNLQRSLVVLFIFILMAAAINCPLATQFLKSRTDDKGRSVTNVIGPDAAAFNWPASTPHDTQWPSPTQWSENRSFGYRNIGVWSGTAGRTTHQMDYQLIGWPLPVYEQVQMWWPWNDPQWQTAAQSDPALRLHWRGVVFNPLILGGGMWLALIAPLVVYPVIRKKIRRRRGRCPMCGYDLRGDLERGCSECGWNRAEVET